MTACRRADAMAKAIQELVKVKDLSSHVSGALVDLSSLSSIKSFLQSFNPPKPLDLVLCNAGIWGPDKLTFAPDSGLELTLATNHLGHFALVNGLLEGNHLESKALSYQRLWFSLHRLFVENGCHIVNVASSLHDPKTGNGRMGGPQFDFEDLKWVSRQWWCMESLIRTNAYFRSDMSTPQGRPTKTPNWQMFGSHMSFREESSPIIGQKWRTSGSTPSARALFQQRLSTATPPFSRDWCSGIFFLSWESPSQRTSLVDGLNRFVCLMNGHKRLENILSKGSLHNRVRRATIKRRRLVYGTLVWNGSLPYSNSRIKISRKYLLGTRCKEIAISKWNWADNLIRLFSI